MQRCFIPATPDFYFMNFNKILLFAILVLTGIGCSDEGSGIKKSSDEKTMVADIEQSNSEDISPVILFFGNSLSAGYGVDPDDSFPGLIQHRLDSLGYDIEVVNAGVTGETTATGKNRLDWVLDRQRVDIFVLELGANDGLRGLPTEETYRNLNEIIEKVKERHPDTEVVLAGMMIPPNMGADYSRDFQEVFRRIGQEKDIHMIPFLLDGVAGESTLNLEDGVHPNEAGHRIVAENVWEVLQPLVEKVSAQSEVRNSAEE